MGRLLGSDWALDLLSMGLKFSAKGAHPPEHDAIVLIHRGNSIICDAAVEGGILLIIPDGTEITAKIDPGLSYAGLLVPSALWVDIQATTTGMLLERRADHVAAIRLIPDETVRVANYLERLIEISNQRDFSDPIRDRILRDYLAEIAMAAGRASGQMKDLTSFHTSRSTIRAAQDYIHSRIQSDIDILSLSKELKISRRQLEYAFRSTVDVSPARYIAAIRLNAIRRALQDRRNDHTTVTDVALRFGVEHLGRFSQDYRRLFGELPSQTLRQGRIRK